MVTLQDWYLEIPPVTRAYLTLSVIVTVACSLDLISPFALYFNVQLIFLKWQVCPCAAAGVVTLLCTHSYIAVDTLPPAKTSAPL